MSDQVIISAIGAAAGVVTVVITSFTTYLLRNLHQQLNSRLDQLLKSEKASSHQAGVEEGKRRRGFGRN